MPRGVISIGKKTNAPKNNVPHGIKHIDFATIATDPRVDMKAAKILLCLMHPRV